MTRLDILNGEFLVDGVIVSNHFTIQELHTNFNELQIGIINDAFESFILPKADNGRIGKIFHFEKKRITFLSVQILNASFPPFEMNEMIIDETKDLLNSLGGNAEYSWGKVFLSIDSKSGVASVVISFTTRFN